MTGSRRRRSGAAIGRCVACASLAAAGAAMAQVPEPGRYEAQFCVASPAEAPAQCGAAELVVHGKAAARLRISDIVYRLRLRSSQLDVTTLHGAMQIDEFSADFEWKDGVLVFADPDKSVRYEIRPGPKQR